MAGGFPSLAFTLQASLESEAGRRTGERVSSRWGSSLQAASSYSAARYPRGGAVISHPTTTGQAFGQNIVDLQAVVGLLGSSASLHHPADFSAYGGMLLGGLGSWRKVCQLSSLRWHRYTHRTSPVGGPSPCHRHSNMPLTRFPQ